MDSLQQSAQSKEELILNVLEKRSLTAMDAFHLFNETCLNSTVSILRKKGHHIDGVRVPFVNSFGRKSSVVKYKLVKRADESSNKKARTEQETRLNH